MPEPTPVSLSQILLDSISEFPRYGKEYLKIQTKKGTLVPFSINEVQMLLEDIIKDIRAKGRLIRLVILKARRKGVSTWVSGRFYYKTTTNTNRYAMIVTHEPEATDFVFKMHKRFQEHVPEFLRPAERYNNKKVLEFNDEQGRGLDSAIRVGTAGKEDFGSAQLIHYLHLSELAKFPRHVCSNLLLSLLQCVPETQDSEIIMEATAKGVGGEFYDRYWSSRYKYVMFLKDGKATFREEINEQASIENDYTSIFIPWFVFDEYQMDIRANFVRTMEEEDLVTRFGITDRQLQWRRWYISNKCNNDVNLFNQEYPATDLEAFLSSSDNVFDLYKLDALKIAAPSPIAKYSVQLVTGNILTDPKGQFHVWEEPRAGLKYVIACDVAEGLEHGDFSNLDVVNVLTGKQVAQWHGHIDPDQYGFVIACIGMRYNKAQVAIERNNHGLATIESLMGLNYSNVYAETIIEPPHRPRKRFGWLTTKKSKPMIIDHLISELRDGIHGINCRETFEEMMCFKKFEDGDMGAEIKKYDDRVISIAIARYLASKESSKLTNRSSISYNKTPGPVRVAPISPRAWT